MLVWDTNVPRRQGVALFRTWVAGADVPTIPIGSDNPLAVGGNMPSPNNIVLNRDEYHYVNMGPIKGKPDWHQQSKPSRYPFPTWRSAMAFAKAHKDAYPDREIIIDLPDGRRWDGQAWVA